MKCVNGLISAWNDKVRPLVDCGMHFDVIVRIAEKIATTTKLTTPSLPLYKQKQYRQWSIGKPKQVQISNYNLPPNMAAAQKQRPGYAGAKNSNNFGHFPNAKEDDTKYKIFGPQNAEKDQLAKKGHCFLHKKPGHVARERRISQPSCSYQ